MVTASDTYTVSVVMPVFNGREFLEEALASVLRQSYAAHEVIVVDDGSSDESPALIEEIAADSVVPVYVFRQTNRGPGAARNRGADLATGELLAFIDQDDVWLETKLQHQVELLQGSPEMDIVLTHQRFFLNAGMARPLWVRPELLDSPLSAMTPSALMVRKRTLVESGGFDERLLAGSDADWFFRASDLGLRIGTVDEVLVHHRIHAGNQSRLVTQFHRELLSLVQQSVKRKQAITGAAREGAGGNGT